MPTTKATEGALTIISPVAPDREADLRALLVAVGEDPANNPHVPFGKIRSLHFARFAILPANTTAHGEALPAQLVFTTNFDAPRDAHLRELLEKAIGGLHRIFAHCADYSPTEQPSSTELLSYLTSHARPEQVFYVGAPGQSVEDIQREQRLRELIEGFLDERGAGTDHWSGHSAVEVRRAIQTFVQGHPDLQWVAGPAPRHPRPLGLLGWFALILLTLLAAPLLLIWLVLVRLNEVRRGEPTPPPPTDAAPDRPEPVQNYLTHVTFVEPGIVRRWTLRFVLGVMNFAGRRIFNQGSLFSLSTLHFVRWVLIDDGRRLLFATNYDGSVSGYVSDFVNRSWQIPAALTALWSNTSGFPRSRWLVAGGARHLPEFSSFLANLRVPTLVWYSAYPWLTCANIVNNARIRSDLFTDLDEPASQAWLRRF